MRRAHQRPRAGWLAFAPPARPLPACARLSRTASHALPPLCSANRETPTHAQTPTKRPRGTPPPLPDTALSLLLLNVVTVLWGTQHAVIKLAIADTPPSTVNLSRFLVAALITLPSLPPPTPRTVPTYLLSAQLALYLFLGYALQSVSLLTTTASRSGFLLYLNVKLVPLFAHCLYNRPVTAVTWASAALALLGTGLLTYDAAPPAAGDAFSVLAAGASAMFILTLERAATHPPSAVNAISLSFVALLCAVWSLLTNAPTTPAHLAALLPTSPTGFAAVLYLGLVTTALSNYLQTLGQRHVPAERAAVIFAMDPVYGAFFASALLGESLGGRGILGAACIAVAALVSNGEAVRAVAGTVEKVLTWLTNADDECDSSTRD